MVNLGFVNGWGGKAPQAYKDHIEACKKEAAENGYPLKVHAVTGVRSGRCVVVNVCQACQIQWSVDSGD